MTALTELERQFILEAIEGWDMNQHASADTWLHRDELEESIRRKLDLDEVRGRKLRFVDEAV